MDPNTNPSLGDDEIGNLLKGLWLLHKFGTSSAGKILEELVVSGRIDHYYNQVANTSGGESAALCMLTILRWNLGVTAPPGVGNSAAGYQSLLKMMGQSDGARASALCSVVEEYGEFGLIFDVTDERGCLIRLLLFVFMFSLKVIQKLAYLRQRSSYLDGFRIKRGSQGCWRPTKLW